MDVKTKSGNKKSKLTVTGTLKEFCLDTTAAGFSKVCEQNGVLRKCVWITFIILALAANAVHLWSLIQGYYSWPIRETIRFSKDPPIFPSVTICNNNPLQSTFDTRDGYYTSSYVLDLLKDFNFSYISTSVSHDYRNIFLSCKNLVDGQEIKSCDKIMLHQSAKYFNCFTIPGGFYVKNSAVEYFLDSDIKQKGLSVQLYLDNTNEFRRYETGARIIIHEPGTIPLPERFGITVQPGRDTYISIEQKQRIKLGEPYSDCTVHAHMEGFPSHEYSTDGCVEACLAMSMYTLNGCFYQRTIVPDLWIQNKGSVCSNIDKDIELGREEYRSCFSKCEEKCDYRTNSFSIDHYIWPHPEYPYPQNTQYIHWDTFIGRERFRNLQEIWNGGNKTQYIEWEKTNLATVYVFFGNANVEVSQEQSLFTMWTLLADIGGILGLYIGISAVTLVEFIILPINLATVGILTLTNLVKPKKKPNSPSVVTTVT